MCRYTRLRRLRSVTLRRPRYRNSLTFHFPFIILFRSRHVFRPYCLSSESIQKFLQETRPRLLLQNFAIESRYCIRIRAPIPLFG